jgi:site-specific DNA-methyltransferase (cytosine-N4-specific)
MSQATMLVGDVFERMAELPDGSFDLIVTSPPFWRQRAYLPPDHPDKALEIGQEASPAEFIDVMLRLTAEWRRLLTPYGSIAVELGDTMAGSGGAGGDYGDGGFRDGQPRWEGSQMRAGTRAKSRPNVNPKNYEGGTGLPAVNSGALPKSHCYIPELYGAALTYGDWPILTGQPHPAGRWIVRNKVVWCRPNPTPGDDGDKFRRATSLITCATLNPRRYWDGDAVRETASPNTNARTAKGIDRQARTGKSADRDGNWASLDELHETDGTRPL